MMMNLMMRLWKDEEGQGIVEYALIIALIAIALVATGILGDLVTALQGLFQDIIDNV